MFGQSRLRLTIVAALAAWASSPCQGADLGVVPVDAKGLPLNLGFEAGSLQDWHAEGAAFAGAPVEGDVVSRRRGDMKSGHDGQFRVGSHERSGDPRNHRASGGVTQGWTPPEPGRGTPARSVGEFSNDSFYKASGF